MCDHKVGEILVRVTDRLQVLSKLLYLNNVALEEGEWTSYVPEADPPSTLSMKQLPPASQA